MVEKGIWQDKKLVERLKEIGVEIRGTLSVSWLSPVL